MMAKRRADKAIHFNGTKTTMIDKRQFLTGLGVMMTSSALAQVHTPTTPPKKQIPQRKARTRPEEHTSELQSLRHLVCRLLLEKKKKKTYKFTRANSTKIKVHNTKKEK